MSEPAHERRIQIDDRVSSLWRTAALMLAAALVAVAPDHFTLLWDHHTELTRVDVDREITLQEAAIVQQLTKLEDKVDDLTTQIDSHRR